VALPANTLPLVPALETNLTPVSLQTCGDQQLLRALSLLTNSPQR
jgi:hypothetical protein